MDDFTDRLEQKVDSILAAQQREFIISYRMHMLRVEREFKDLQG